MASNAEVTVDGDMAPSASPGGGGGRRGRFAGVRRLNDWPVYILGVIVVAFIIVAITIAVGRSQKNQKVTDETAQAQKTADASRAANAVLGAQSSPLAPATVKATPVAGGPLGTGVDANGVPIATPPGGVDGAPPAPPLGPAPGVNGQPVRAVPPPKPLTVAQQARLKRLAARYALFDSAVAAPTGVRQIAARSPGSPPPPADATGPTDVQGLRAQLEAARAQGDATATGAQAQLADFERSAQAAGAGGGLGGSGLANAAGIAAQDASSIASGSEGRNGTRNSYDQFGGRGNTDRWRLAQSTQAPRSPYELRAGFVIPATLISGVNSDLPGQIVGQVSQNVWDTPTGRHLLVPQGSRLVGAYSANVVYGQRRILIAWQRIVFPDGKALDLGSMPGGDAAGYAGFKDQVQTHFFRVISQAVLLSAVTAGISLSQPQDINSNGQVSAQSALSQALGQQLGQVTSELIRKNLNVSPTLVIRPGYRFNVIVVKDLTFSKPYQPFDY